PRSGTIAEQDNESPARLLSRTRNHRLKPVATGNSELQVFYEAMGEDSQARAPLMRQYLTHKATRALTRTGGFLKGFSFSLNPYVGCAFGDNGGCPFCYVRALPVAHSVDSGWGSWVIAKMNLPEPLEHELDGLARSGRIGETAI